VDASHLGAGTSLLGVGAIGCKSSMNGCKLPGAGASGCKLSRSGCKWVQVMHGLVQVIQEWVQVISNLVQVIQELVQVSACHP
jgi:hypothetical protein